METTTQQRNKIYLAAAEERFNDITLQFGICHQLEKYGLFAYSEKDVQYDVTKCSSSYKELDRNCPEIKLITLNDKGTYNYFESESDDSRELRIFSLLFAAELCD